MKLPQEFLNKMQNLLEAEEYKAFIDSYDAPRHYGLRVNTLKVSVDEFSKISPFRLEPVLWTADGFYYPEGESPGKHPYYYAGLYYIQEPSAMLPGAVINAQRKEAVLDLCAAPGGKTVQMAAGMKGEGLLVANDINADRVRALVKNIELAGIRNAVVTNDTPQKLAERFVKFFDRILVDAPCSGEGMFRKDEEAARSWESFKCEKCCQMQRNILQSVDKMLKPGGVLVYSTCTFSPEENEKMIAEFLDMHPDYEIESIPKVEGIEDGRPEWADGNEALSRTARLWPHRIKGEGHFVAMLRKSHRQPPSSFKMPTGGNGPEVKPNSEIHDSFLKFMNDNMNISIEGSFIARGNNLYCLPACLPDLSGIKVAKFGWYLGSLEKGRFEPSHSMALSLKKKDFMKTIDLSSGSSQVLSYLKGETLMIEGEKGYTAVCVDGYTLGWAKQTGDMLKNLYPKGWRKMV
ncbi:MAG: RsmB/NOP family class I SAM-dependent RNA methyltransferase [Clostridia bacterium]|nr:RsmB/NOP family class I SAM-dependent RNA methyltransferase [Clostridia bacterium]